VLAAAGIQWLRRLYGKHTSDTPGDDNQRCSSLASGGASCWPICYGTCCAVTCISCEVEMLTLYLAGLVGGDQVGGGGRQSTRQETSVVSLLSTVAPTAGRGQVPVLQRRGGGTRVRRCVRRRAVGRRAVRAAY